jgi:hypothetical protein
MRLAKILSVSIFMLLLGACGGGSSTNVGASVTGIDGASGVVTVTPI